MPKPIESSPTSWWSGQARIRPAVDDGVVVLPQSQLRLDDQAYLDRYEVLTGAHDGETPPWIFPVALEPVPRWKRLKWLTDKVIRIGAGTLDRHA